MRKTFKKMLLLALGLVLMNACAYEDYVTDYDYSAVYFGTQSPLRTLVARDNKETLDFKTGVVLSGLRENNSDQWVEVEIDPSLLTSVAGASAFQLLPSNWYTMSGIDANGRFTIPKGSFLGDFTISIKKDLFAADPASLGKTYALPLRIKAASADSILRGTSDGVVAAKDYTIIVVKYISERCGTYYAKGSQQEVDAVGTAIGDPIFYSKTDLSRNATKIVSTLSLQELQLTNLGDPSSSGIAKSDKLTITFLNDQIALSHATGASVLIVDEGSTYNSVDKKFQLKYIYQKGSRFFKVEEQLILRQDPELDLRFEEWK